MPSISYATITKIMCVIIGILMITSVIARLLDIKSEP